MGGSCDHCSVFDQQVSLSCSHGKVPVEILSKTTPDLSHLKVYGCLDYVTFFEEVRKFAPRAVPVIFLGYSLTQKVYKIYILQEKTFTTSQDVVFKEDVFPFQHLSNTFPPIISAPLCSTKYCQLIIYMFLMIMIPLQGLL